MKKRVSQSYKAGLTFPVGRVGRKLTDGKLSERVGKGAVVGLAAVMEFLCAELMEITGEVCKNNQRKRIISRDIELAVRNDMDFAKLLKNKFFRGSGVSPFIYPDPKELASKVGPKSLNSTNDLEEEQL